jgi:ParB family chromosome partitioning protein
MAFQGDSIYWVEVEKVVPNPFQPRREFDQGKLQELADSIRMYGVLQPLTVTRNEVQREDGTFYTEYELIAGERRLRASKLAGTPQVPVIIREGEQSEQEKLELAIIENLQREDLNAVDRAIAFKQLAEMFGLSHAQVAQKVGRSREYVSNSIRLLGLPEKILESLKHGNMSEGHARTLLMLNDRPQEQDVIYREILLKKMSVREVERIIRKIATDKVRKKSAGDLDSNLIEYEKQFTETLGTRVQIQKTDFGGKLTIDYFSVEDLEGMLERMKKEVAELVPEQEAIEKLAEHTPLEQVREAQERAYEQSESPVIAPESPRENLSQQFTDQATEQLAEPEPEPEPEPESVLYPSATTAPKSVFQAHEMAPSEESESLYQYLPRREGEIIQTHVPDRPIEPRHDAPDLEMGPSPLLTPDRLIEELRDDTPTPDPILPPPPEPDKKPAPVEHGHHQPFTARYAPQSFQSNQFVRPDSVEHVQPQPQPQPQPISDIQTAAKEIDTPPVVPQPVEDESSLYSIRNFNI